MIDYLIPESFRGFDPMLSQGTHNAGGGAGTKFASVLRGLSFCDIAPRFSVAELQNSILMVEPLCFRWKSDDDLLANIIGYGAFANILYSTDVHPMRWSGKFRQSVDSFFSGEYDCVTYCCEFQRKLFESIGFSDMQILVDPIDTDLFIPLPKKLQLVACGRIASFKNSEFIRDLFVALKDIAGISTVYVGGAGLYGVPGKIDLVLEHEIRLASDLFLNNVSQIEVARVMGESSFFVANNVYDVFSESHVESLSAGCVSVCGGHPVYSERPGFYRDVLTVDDVVSALDEYTMGFARLPDSACVDESRTWVLDNASYRVFNTQLRLVLSEWFGSDSYVIEV